MNTRRHLIMAIAGVGAADCLLPTMASAQVAGLRAHDINGFELGMTREQAAAHAGTQLERIVAGDYQVNAAGVKYDFGFTRLGHIYRIDSRQDLGVFTPDRAFLLDLRRKLSAKYGPTNVSSFENGPWFWTFGERYIATSGMALSRETESLAVTVSGYAGQAMELTMKLMAFRILRQDGAAANAGPQSDAERAISF